jgi:hypothetical protein
MLPVCLSFYKTGGFCLYGYEEKGHEPCHEQRREPRTCTNTTVAAAAPVPVPDDFCASAIQGEDRTFSIEEEESSRLLHSISVGYVI